MASCIPDLSGPGPISGRSQPHFIGVRRQAFASALCAISQWRSVDNIHMGVNVSHFFCKITSGQHGRLSTLDRQT